MLVSPSASRCHSRWRRAISEDFMKLNSRTCGCRPVVCLSVLIVAVLISASAFAQSTSNPKWDAFIGYQYQQADGDNVPTPGSNPNSPGSYTFPDMAKGIGGALTYNFNRYWGLESDFGYSRNSDQAASEWTASAGPRFMIRAESYSF